MFQPLIYLQVLVYTLINILEVETVDKFCFVFLKVLIIPTIIVLCYLGIELTGL